ncbi:glycosyltransferase [Sphingomicrobium sp. XHP0235]|uniref:glycosyltransferase n=1 Tax=Sphingomicrobium aquimarinum TaxID=3133971 RepID=UPI0031FE9981
MMFTASVPRRIAVIAHMRFPIRPPFKGGMESHTHALVRSLKARGHEVALFASGDSDPSLPLVPACERHYEADMPWALWHGDARFDAMQKRIFNTAWDEMRGFAPDVVHNNCLYGDIPRWAARDGIAMVTVLHVPPFARLSSAVEEVCDDPGQRFVTVSRSQLKHWPTGGHPHFSAVPNGIDLDRWGQGRERRESAVWIGRITPTKGTAMACRAALTAGMPLSLYGPIEDEGYFAETVAPLLGDQIRYEGAQSADRLRDAYRRARVALVTPCWDEPFGLVAAEALACGTPVAGFARGAIGEVVGEAGCLVEEGDVAGLARAMRRASSIAADTCLRRAGLFSQQRMLERYEALYESAISGAASRASSCSRTVAELA